MPLLPIVLISQDLRGLVACLSRFTTEGTDISQDRLAAIQMSKGTGGGVGAGLMDPSLGVDSCGFLTPVSTLAQCQLVQAGLYSLPSAFSGNYLALPLLKELCRAAKNAELQPPEPSHNPAD